LPASPEVPAVERERQQQRKKAHQNNERKAGDEKNVLTV
jgi:hypothetical protein